MTSHASVLLRNAEVIDGTGAKAFIADVAVIGKSIAAIEPRIDCSADRVFDCAGLTLTPGFIDAHTHDDRAILVDRGLNCKISQGVTSVIVGNCGISLTPCSKHAEGLPDPFRLIARNDGDFFATAKAYFSCLDAQPPAVNFASLVGHSTLRLGAGVSPDRGALEPEIAFMAHELGMALSEGAKGLSLGLEYPAACAANGDEIAPLLSILGKHKAILTAHIRSESDAIVEAIDEVASLAARAGVPIILSHHKCSGKHNFGRSTETLSLIEAAARKQKILFDAYPYAVGMTVLLERFVKICEKTVISSSSPHPELAGGDIRDVAQSFQCTIEEAIRRVSPATALYYIMDEGDVRRILAHPLGMIGSDGLHDQRPHPRLWGTFPRFFGHYVRDLELLEWEEAVRKTTSLPAKTFSLSKRGEIKENFFADIVVFDKSKIRDAGTFERPEQRAEGIVSVFTNGTLVWNEGRETGEYPGERV